MLDVSKLSSTEIAQKLLTIIREEGLAPGDRLPSIRQLSVRFSVRPHLVRDALLQMQSMGHVVVRPRSRAVVQGVRFNVAGREFPALAEGLVETGAPHLFHLLEARQTLEFELAGQAATRRRLEDLLPCRDALDAMHAIDQTERPQEHLEIDMRFHLAIAQLADNPVLTSMLKSLLSAMRPFLLSKSVDRFHADRTAASHREIYRALVAGDPALARHHMKQHLQLAYDRLLLDIQSVPAKANSTTVDAPPEHARLPQMTS